MNIQYIPVLAFAPLLALSFYLGYTPLFVPVTFLTVSLIAFAVYYKDKSAAINGAWRTPESTLHLLALLCGWPGAIIAQQTSRHKTQKRSFRIVFWFTVLINAGAFLWLHTPEGSRAFRTNVGMLDARMSYFSGSYTISNYIHQLTKFPER